MTGLKYRYNFLAMMHGSDRLYCNNYELKLYLTVNTDSEFDQDIAFNRMDFFIQEIISNAVFVHEDEPELLERYMNLGIPAIAIQEPGTIDHMILMTLVTKLNAICEDAVIIYNGEMSSVLGQGVEYVYFVDGEEIVLSDQADKWWNDTGPTFISKDCLTTPEEQTVHDFEPKITWKDYDLVWEYEYVEPEEEMKQADIPDNVIKLTDYNKK